MRRQLLVMMGVILALVAYLAPKIVIERKRADRTSATSNLRQIGICLYEFESEYGKFPDATTASLIKRKTGSSLTLSDRTSNDVFIQLLASGICRSERNFYTYTATTRTPDGNWSSDATALEHGETGFAYVSGLSSTRNPSTPIVFGPIIPGTHTVDAKSHADKAVILKLDNSVSSVPIDAAGRIIINGGDLLDPANPIWEGKAPDIKWPK